MDLTEVPRALPSPRREPTVNTGKGFTSGRPVEAPRAERFPPAAAIACRRTAGSCITLPIRGAAVMRLRSHSLSRSSDASLSSTAVLVSLSPAEGRDTTPSSPPTRCSKEWTTSQYVASSACARAFSSATLSAVCWSKPDDGADPSRCSSPRLRKPPMLRSRSSTSHSTEARTRLSTNSETGPRSSSEACLRVSSEILSSCQASRSRKLLSKLSNCSEIWRLSSSEKPSANLEFFRADSRSRRTLSASEARFR
mmetsp:Transcript_9961/g.22220  ORF Transcript_9961/g.22220 Transcript_9961/m.22220 type:complete len:253 (+) Transcript_9961:1161-1919(+)